jgi:hypothetical protein
MVNLVPELKAILGERSPGLVDRCGLFMSL